MSVRVRFLSAALASIVCGTLAVSAQSLGEVARKEQQRRKATKTSGKVYTNKDLGPDGTRPAPVLPPAAGTTAGPGGAETAPPAPETAGEQDPKKTEAYWRDQMAALQAEIQRDELFLESLQSRVNALTTDFVNRDDYAQRGVISVQRQRALAEMERVQVEIEALKKQVVDLEEEARQAGVPPGWLR